MMLPFPGKLNPVPFWAFEIEPYSASSYSKVLQPSTHVPGETIVATRKSKNVSVINQIIISKRQRICENEIHLSISAPYHR